MVSPLRSLIEDDSWLVAKLLILEGKILSKISFFAFYEFQLKIVNFKNIYPTLPSWARMLIALF